MIEPLVWVPIDKSEHTPMMVQYLTIKEKYTDAFLFYRLGDFYELFFSDAILAARLLELTLTARNKTSKNPVDMCGIPHHASSGYIEKLVDLGYKVAICEQISEPSEKGLVERDVIQVITPGTNVVESAENNFLVSVIDNNLAYTDLSTGELKVTTVADDVQLINEIIGLRTLELVVYGSKPLSAEVLKKTGVMVSTVDALVDAAEINFAVEGVSDAGQIEALQLLLSYVIATQKRNLNHIKKAESYVVSDYLQMDYFTKQNLELVANQRQNSKMGSLLWVLDKTKTALGTRELKTWIDKPLVNIDEIVLRQNQVATLLDSFFERCDIIEIFKRVYDLERLIARLSFGKANARDLHQLKISLSSIPQIRTLLSGINKDDVFAEILAGLPDVSEVVAYIDAAIIEDAPLTITDGGIIKTGFNDQLDDYRKALSEGKTWLAELEAREKELTGIKNLKVGYSRNFGYHIEISKVANQGFENERYTRVQTLTNAERYTTEELSGIEEKINEAETGSAALEYKIFTSLRDYVSGFTEQIQMIARTIAQIDCLQSLAQIAEDNQYIKPEFYADGDLEIIDGRHPVVEKVTGSSDYVPNSVVMNAEREILILTGPNMSGKSTYMRQLAIIVIMAQIGSFVPAKSARIPVVDKIFTRIGASDDLVGGQSTFMVEMSEANLALEKATPNSLILFDELGRGTATYDGMALAQAIIEYIAENIKAKTVFSTHYHELVDLADKYSEIQNIHVGVNEDAGEIVFLHKIFDGPADQSYGIHVAKLAGLPDKLLKRSANILHTLETGVERPMVADDDVPYLASTPESPVLAELRELDINNLTPLEALSLIYELKEKL
ncbi:MAG: DNA mismatch repair protein MutS [Lactobacillales bacterium]|jgi:DNA mismatch repair protein MutS|nr:DNA mismatch repair protein MutS [Lactobacillales bacterium]